MPAPLYNKTNERKKMTNTNKENRLQLLQQISKKSVGDNKSIIAEMRPMRLDFYKTVDEANGNHEKVNTSYTFYLSQMDDDNKRKKLLCVRYANPHRSNQYHDLAITTYFVRTCFQIGISDLIQPNMDAIDSVREFCKENDFDLFLGQLLPATINNPSFLELCLVLFANDIDKSRSIAKTYIDKLTSYTEILTEELQK